MSGRALSAYGVIGAVFGLAVAYILFQAKMYDPVDFVMWLSPNYWGQWRNALVWAIAGAIVGVAVAYIRGSK